MPRANSKTEDEVEDVENENASGQEGSDEEESEYEIEAIVDYKIDFFGKGVAGYQVKWKGYPESENSWVKPEDAENAKELIREFMAKRQKKRGRPSRTAIEATPESEDDNDDDGAQKERKSTPAKGRKSTGGASMAKTSASATKGRASAAASSAKKKQNLNKVDTDEDEDEDEGASRSAKTGKRGRQSNGGAGAAGRKKRARTQDKDDDEDEEMDEDGSGKGSAVGNADNATRPSQHPKYRDRAVWESAVSHVDTVERNGDVLQVFFRLKGIKEPCVEDNDICKQKFPQKLLEFYEKNLRWKTAEDEAD